MTRTSPTPWAVNFTHPDVWIEGEDDETNLADVHGDSFEQAKANAAYIVQCVNAHAGLVVALQAAVKYGRHTSECRQFEDDGVHCVYHPEWCSCGWAKTKPFLESALEAAGVTP